MPLTSAQAALLLFGDDVYGDYIRWPDTIDSDIDYPEYFDCDVNVFYLVRHAITSSARGELPDPYVYKAFMNRLRVSGKLYPSNIESEAADTSLVIASRCRHPIHPGNPTVDPEACPPCVMEQCVASLERIWEVWEMLGAPHKNYAFAQDEALYFKVKAIWRCEKTRWANIVAKYEELGEMEEAWEEADMQMSEYTFEELNNAQSCRAALQIARTRNPLRMDGEDMPFTPRPLQGSAWRPSTPNAPLRFRSPKSQYDESPESPTPLPPDEIPSSPPLVVDPGTLATDLPSPVLSAAEEPTTPPSSPKFPTLEPSASPPSSPYTPSDAPLPPSSLPASPPQTPLEDKKRVRFSDEVEDGQKRPLASFHRLSPAYKRGRHACPSNDGWEDTSFNREPLYPYIDDDDDEFSDWMDEDEEANAAYRKALTSLGVQEADVDLNSDFESDSESESDSDADSDSSSIALVNGENDGTARLSNQSRWASWDVQGDFVLFGDDSPELDSCEFDDAEAEDIMMDIDEDDLR